MFCDTVTDSDNTMVLDCDLGLAIDIGPAMTRKVLKENGQEVYQSTVRPLTPDEILANTTAKAAQEKIRRISREDLG